MWATRRHRVTEADAHRNTLLRARRGEGMSGDCCASSGQFDLAVIGAGSAGFSAAITAAEQGARVLLVGHGTIGGTCVNTGCVPSKTLIRATDVIHQAKAATRFDGLHGEAQVRDWAALIAQKQQLVDSLRQAKYTDVLPAHDSITWLEGRARLVDNGILVDGQAFTAPRVVIATGARAAIPDIPGLDTVPFLTSTGALEMEQLPASLLVMGGGYIGCELAQMFARAGVAVTLMTRRTLLADAEPEVSTALTECFRGEGITVHEGVAYRAARASDGRITVIFDSTHGSCGVEAQRLLLATGRTPNVEGLGLDAAGIELNDAGGIAVDDRMQTSVPGIYAAGDVTGQDQFVYMAAYGAKIAASNALGDSPLRYQNHAMPAVVFTDPQVARVGLTERQALDAGIDVRTSVLPLRHLPRALAARDTRGLIKLVAEAAGGRLLGAHIIAPEGADSIQTAAIAINQRLTAEELGQMIFPYLTTVEGLKLAAQAFDKDVASLSCCAG